MVLCWQIWKLFEKLHSLWKAVAGGDEEDEGGRRNSPLFSCRDLEADQQGKALQTTLKLVLPSCPLPLTQLSSRESPKMAGWQTMNLEDDNRRASLWDLWSTNRFVLPLIQWDICAPAQPHYKYNCTLCLAANPTDFSSVVKNTLKVP